MSIRYMLFSGMRILLPLALFLTLPDSYAAGRCKTAIARAVSIQGMLEVRYAGQTGWQLTTREAEFCTGDALRTGTDSRAAIQLFPETIIRLDQSSSIVFTPAEDTADSTWLDLLKGAAHLISRDPRSLQVITPFANAAIEGTEFLVEVDATQTAVTVYEGHVRVATADGEVTLANGEQAVARTGATPFKQVLLNPRDAVQWTLYYPPVLAGGNTLLLQAQQALAVGQVAVARSLLDMLLQQDPDNSDALALQSIIALTLDDRETARALATRAVTAAPDSATTHIALSYVQQADFDLTGALISLQTATREAPDSALAWARLAELWLSVGELDRGVTAAERAVALDASLAHSHTMLGFAWLTEIRIPEAITEFEQAIALDQAAPLPRLGLGLARIRKGDLRAGREEIEFAVTLDPANSLLRSYMGKAYYEEKRGRLAGEQYAMARQLDPNDPTPWFYDAIRKQTENRPVEALHDLQTSIKLNDNRAVYRSRLELDADLATRSASIARIYSNLGFEQRALVEGWQSVNTDPTNFSAHRLLADSYASQPRHQIARVSELLQSQLLQPLSLTPVQPQLAETDVLLLDNAGPSDASFLEFNPLFTRNRLALQADAVVGGNDTRGDDLIQSGVYNNWSWSAGQFHYESDGYRDNNDQDEDVYNLFVQTALTYRTSIQTELRHRESETGDLLQRFDPDNFLPTQRNSLDTDSARLGLHHLFSPGSEVIASLVWERNEDHQNSDTPVGPFAISAKLKGPLDGHNIEVQHLYRGESLRLISGAAYAEADGTLKTSLLTSPPPPPVPGAPPASLFSQTDQNYRSHNAYVYAYLPYGTDVTVTLGASYDDLDINNKNSDTLNGVATPTTRAQLNVDKFNPKLGISWELTPETTLRTSAFRAVRRNLVADQTIEPTQVAGFNQFYDDATGTVEKRYGIGLDHDFSANLSAGVEISKRDLDVPYLDQGDYEEVDWEERMGRAYLYWTPHKRIGASLEYLYERFSRDSGFTGETLATRIRTNKLPLSVNYFHPKGYIAGLTATYFDQEGDFIGGAGLSPVSQATTTMDDDFWVVDSVLGYRLSKRRGLVSIGVSNLFDESFNYVDTD
ncbi:MAG TPA: TonB-dependent receptor, partial [Gammaproteobacteria bacterium]|nr:TonB-dependent receptor [Gammaproteobacteria bacterium]